MGPLPAQIRVWALAPLRRNKRHPLGRTVTRATITTEADRETATVTLTPVTKAETTIDTSSGSATEASETTSNVRPHAMKAGRSAFETVVATNAIARSPRIP